MCVFAVKDHHHDVVDDDDEEDADVRQNGNCRVFLYQKHIRGKVIDIQVVSDTARYLEIADRVNA